ncbi:MULTISPECIES: DUF2786 domain-containing protein [Listeria]|uniref:DUF7168 domain-containing protein n=1 Tax=Listeria TaxID=1637 RepID=UPI000B58F114|nr:MULTISPECIES: DUF2786 domain-containing protein [Listeria]
MEENEQLRRIQKLLALASDANEKESQAALAKAQALMMEQQVSEDEVIQYDRKMRLDCVVERIVYSGRPQKWVYRLCRIIAANFRVKTFYQDGMPIQLVFLGIERDVQVAEITFLYAMGSVQYGAREFMKRPEVKRKYKRKWGMKQDYIEGYLQALQATFKTQVVTNGYELSLQLPEIVIKAVNQKQLVPGKNRQHVVQEAEAYYQGYKDGEEFRQKESIE